MTPAEAPVRDLHALARRVATHPGTRGKAAIGLVSEVFGGADWLRGPGDDGAVVETGGGRVVACGEALWPPFVARDPWGAGFAAVLTNVNDVAAMGAEPLGIVNTVSASEGHARAALEGMRHACALFDVPVLGGHLTSHDGEPSISAFALGAVDQPLSVTRVAPGQGLVVAAALDGTMRPDFPFFPAFEQRGGRCAGDVRVLAALARRGAAVAAKDVSMAGLVGSLAMLLEWGTFGVEVDLDAVPTPAGVDLGDWLTCFPSFCFLLCVPPGREADAVGPFRARGLEAAVVGRIDETGRVRLRRGDEVADAFDLTREGVTRLTRDDR
ncbi:AIR synthase related protein [Actinomycetospora lutea]|uniref:AIR synthase related protein n=1 Tax=Actinomycetospora lutea TaxID=663604 RepID=UPI002366A658|nr:AIR synthase related protein [Actinomycetospora lutea]MDD7938297.1 AIR synthase related protein [Actinomycetospora lutea]